MSLDVVNCKSCKCVTVWIPPFLYGQLYAITIQISLEIF